MEGVEGATKLDAINIQLGVSGSGDSLVLVPTCSDDDDADADADADADTDTDTDADTTRRSRRHPRPPVEDRLDKFVVFAFAFGSGDRETCVSDGAGALDVFDRDVTLISTV